MDLIKKGLVGFACLAFLLAIIATLGDRIFGVPAEAFSRACNNLAIIAIALTVCFKKKTLES